MVSLLFMVIMCEKLNRSFLREQFKNASVDFLSRIDDFQEARAIFKQQAHFIFIYSDDSVCHIFYILYKLINVEQV